MNSFKLVLSTALATCSIWIASAEAVILGHERGGGHPVVFEFQRAFRRAVQVLKADSLRPLTAEQWSTLEARARGANYVIANEEVVVVHDGLYSKVVAANDVQTQTVTIDHRAWRELTEPILAAATAFHEIASLAGLEGPGRYALSARYVELSDTHDEECEAALGVPAVPIRPEHLARLVTYADVISKLERIGVLTLAEVNQGAFEEVIPSEHSRRDHVYSWMVMDRLTLPNGRQFIFDPCYPKKIPDKNPAADYKPYAPEVYSAPYPDGRIGHVRILI